MQLAARTALWVGKLKRERRPEDVVRVLAAISRTNPEALSIMESHFRGFCVALPPAETAKLWAAEQERISQLPNGQEPAAGREPGPKPQAQEPQAQEPQAQEPAAGREPGPKPAAQEPQAQEPGPKPAAQEPQAQEPGPKPQAAAGQEASEDPDAAIHALRALYWADNPDDCLLETESYEDMRRKIEYEWGYWKCANPVGYVRVDDKTGEICILSQNKMRDLLCDKYYHQPSQTSRIEGVPLGARWIADDKKRRYARIVVDPTMRHDPTEYNMWHGFAAEKLPPVPHDEIADLVKPLLNHVFEVLASGQEKEFNYIVDWMSFLVQKPERRTQTLLLFYGMQGTGKGLIWDFLREKVLGQHVCTQTANAKQDLFDRFSNGFLHKRLVQLDEAQDIRSFEDNLKNKVTASELRYEKKGQDTITVANFANFVLTTNNMITLRVASDDRRLVMFACSDVHRKNIGYFNTLCHHLRNERLPRAVYQYFMARNLTAYASEMAFQSLRPITQLYNDTRSDSLGPEYLFLSALVNHYPEEHAVIRILIPELYNSYKGFVSDGFGTETRPMHHTTFGRFVGKVPQQCFEKDRGGKTYTIQLGILRKHLVKFHSYDKESMLPSKPITCGHH